MTTKEIGILQRIIEKEEQNRKENGAYGINECKKSVYEDFKYLGKDFWELLNVYLHRAISDPFFNKTMVLACWEILNDEDNVWKR